MLTNPTATARRWLSCALLLFLFVQVDAVRLDQCRAKFVNETGQAGPLEVTYHQCLETCGRTAGEFKWTMFSQGFGAWLLPWIALMFQLPFGAADRFHNLVSVFMAIGSPALAGYSLAITRLNSRWLMNQFSYPHFPNNNRIPLAVSALQHIPFRIDGSGSLLPSLVVLRQNNRYWEVLEVAAKRTRQWTIPVAMNIVWVLVAFSLTIVDSFVDFSYFITVPGNAGYSIAAVWTYLLPLVVGWLHVGSQPEANHLRNALEEAHNTAYVATPSKPVLATQINGRFTRAIEFSTKHINYINADEEKTAPIFNYSRVFVWSQSAEHILKLYQHAAAKAELRITVHGGEWMGSDEVAPTHNWTGNEAEVMQYCTAGRQAPVHFNPSDPQPPIPLAPYSASPPSPRPSTMTLPTARMYANADVFVNGRSSSTFSKYDEEVLSKYDEEAPAKYDEEAPSTEVRTVPEKPIFATEVLQRVAVATVLALGLQWGTTGASVLIHLNTPPKGIGCRATTFTVYGIAATLAFWLLLFSSVFAHLARHQSFREKRSGLKTFFGYIAVFARWSGKFIAIINGIGILISCIMQFAGVYDSCFCSSNIFGGDPNGLVSFMEKDPRQSEVYMYWIGGIIMAFGASGLCTFAIYVATPMG